MKNQRISITIIGILMTVLLISVMLSFTVREGQSAIVTTFGKVDRTLAESGMYVRWPWPIQQIHRFDMRLQSLPGTMEQALTEDGNNVLMTVYGAWRIQDPLLFFERLGTMDKAETSLDNLLRNAKNATIGRYPFSALVNVDPDQFKLASVERDILAMAQPEAASRYGLEIVSVGIRQLALPDAIAEKIYARMRAEREEVAERFRAEGESEAIRVRAEADGVRDRLLAEAEAEAKRIRADGDAAAADSYKVFEKDPKLANFLKKLEVLEETLSTKSTVVLSSDTEPYDLLRGMEASPSE